MSTPPLRGINDGLESGIPHPLGATWGLGWYIDIAGGGTFENYDFRVRYDLDPTAGTVLANHGTLSELFLTAPHMVAAVNFVSSLMLLLDGIDRVMRHERLQRR